MKSWVVLPAMISLLAGSPFGWYHYNLGGNHWTPGFAAAYSGSLTPFGPFTALNGKAPYAGSYTFYFGVDMKMNGSPDLGVSYYDSVEVTVL